MQEADARRARPLVLASAAALAVHLADEALGRMHDDPLIAWAYAWIAPLGGRHAAYLVFQVSFAIALSAALLVAHGGHARRAVVIAWAIALIVEAHHPVRAIVEGATNAGLWTSLPLPLLGVALVLHALHAGEGRAAAPLRPSQMPAIVRQAPPRSAPR